MKRSKNVVFYIAHICLMLNPNACIGMPFEFEYTLYKWTQIQIDVLSKTSTLSA